MEVNAGDRSVVPKITLPALTVLGVKEEATSSLPSLPESQGLGAALVQRRGARLPGGQVPRLRHRRLTNAIREVDEVAGGPI
jgi:hypothetical protein